MYWSGYDSMNPTLSPVLSCRQGPRVTFKSSTGPLLYPCPIRSRTGNSTTALSSSSIPKWLPVPSTSHKHPMHTAAEAGISTERNAVSALSKHARLGDLRPTPLRGRVPAVGRPQQSRQPDVYSRPLVSLCPRAERRAAELHWRRLPPG